MNHTVAAIVTHAAERTDTHAAENVIAERAQKLIPHNAQPYIKCRVSLFFCEKALCPLCLQQFIFRNQCDLCVFAPLRET